MNKLTKPSDTSNTERGGILNLSPRQMDDKLNKLCHENGLIKKKIIASIGSTPGRYKSKLNFNGLSTEEIERLKISLYDLSSKIETFEFSSDHFLDINILRNDLFIKKNRLSQALNRPKSYLSADLEAKRILQEREIAVILAELKKIAKNLKEFTI